MLKVLLNKFHQDFSESLLSPLPIEDRRAVLAQTIQSTDASFVLTEPERLISKVHYSWLAPSIKSLPQSIQAHALSALSDAQFDQIKSMLPEFSSLSKGSLKPSFMTSYLIRRLYHSLDPKDVLPAAFLPDTPFSVLCDYSKQQLVELVDLLGIYDLAGEMRQIIDQQRLKLIQPCLSGKKKQFLRLCLHKEKGSISRLDLDKWDGDCHKLNRLLHHRGLLRLGKGLTGQHPDLVWHIAHTFDTGRGSTILQHFASSTDPKVTKVLAQQLINAINFLNPKRAT